MNLPSLSIVIPCFNRAEMVGDAIRSALDQDIGAEVIVVDDGSTDNSWQVIRSFDSVIGIRTENKGVSAARNRGIAAAKGSYIQFLDSDDLLVDGSTRKLLAMAKRLPTMQIATGAAVVRSTKANPPSYGFASLVTHETVSGDLLLRHPMPCCLPLFPREALTAVGGFDENLFMGEDYVLAVQIHALGYRFFQTNIESCMVRDHEGDRLTRRMSAATFKNLTKAFSTISNIANDVSLEGRMLVGQFAWSSARDASRRGLKREANALFRLANNLGEQNSWIAPLPMKFLYRIASPYSTERLFEFAKRVLRPLT